MAILDDRVRVAARRWPALHRVIADQHPRQARRASRHLAALVLPRVEDRVLALFCDVADRWGRVTPDGIRVDLPLTHGVIGQLVAAQRPTVSLALSELAAGGALVRGPIRAGCCRERPWRPRSAPSGHPGCSMMKGRSRLESFDWSARISKDGQVASMPTDAEQQDLNVEEPRVNVLMEVSSAMIRLFKEQFGRGPTSARTHWAGPDALTCILEDTLTPAERNLVKLGEHQRLRDTRLYFQYASVAEFCRPVERITGRTVRAFHSSTDTEAGGQSVEVFVLFPEGYDGPSRIDRCAP